MSGLQNRLNKSCRRCVLAPGTQLAPGAERGEQFGVPFAPLGPSGGNDYFTPNFWVGRSLETVGRRGPITSLKVSPF